MISVRKDPLYLEPGDVIIHPQTGEPVEIASKAVRCWDCVTVDYRIPGSRTEGLMAIRADRTVEVRLTSRQHQKRAVQVLADLLTRQLPPLSWTLGRKVVALYGSVLAEADEAAAVVAEWADALGVEPRREEVGDAGVARPGAVHIARASVDGVTVSIEGYAQAGQMTFDERLAALDQMSTGEHYMALAWMAEHEPEAFRRAAAYVQRVRERDAAAEDGR